MLPAPDAEAGTWCVREIASSSVWLKEGARRYERGVRPRGVRDPRPLCRDVGFYELLRTSTQWGDTAQTLGRRNERGQRKAQQEVWLTGWDDGVQLGAEGPVTWGLPGDKFDGG